MVRQAGRLVAQAQGRFVTAVLTARSAGCTWRQSGPPRASPIRACIDDFARHMPITKERKAPRSEPEQNAATELRTPEVDDGD